MAGSSLGGAGGPAAISGEAESREAEEHHDPGRKFGDAGDEGFAARIAEPAASSGGCSCSSFAASSKV
jgi:hypothetical protein